MSIDFACPNGHKLKIKEDSAGKTIRCPVCNSAVTVPNIPDPNTLSEEAILGILGPHQPGRASTRPLGLGEGLGDEPDTAAFFGPPKKPCPKCHREIEAETHICPYCQTYVANLENF